MILLWSSLTTVVRSQAVLAKLITGEFNPSLGAAVHVNVALCFVSCRPPTIGRAENQKNARPQGGEP